MAKSSSFALAMGEQLGTPEVLSSDKAREARGELEQSVRVKSHGTASSTWLWLIGVRTREQELPPMELAVVVPEPPHGRKTGAMFLKECEISRSVGKAFCMSLEVGHTLRLHNGDARWRR